MEANSMNVHFSPSQDKRSAILQAAFRALLDNTSDLVFIKDTSSTYITASAPFVQMTGKQSVAELIGRTDTEIFEDENLAKRYMLDDQKLLCSGKDLINYIEPLTDEKGHARYGSTSKYILSDSDGTTIGILGITRDITRDYLAQQRYQQELKYLFTLPEDTYAAVFIDIVDWRIISQRRHLVGGSTLPLCNTVEQLRQAALEGIVDSDSDAAKFYTSFSPEFLREIYESGRNSFSLKYLRHMPDGSTRWIHGDVTFLTDPESGHLCTMLSTRDIDFETRENLDLVLSATTDKMTALLNRETTMRSIQNIFAKEPDALHALFILDVDNFKSLNDTMGHQTGDQFLVSLADVLRSSFRESDIVGRIGGDEFFILMKNIPSLSIAQSKAALLLSSIQNLCSHYLSVSLSASIGISLYPEHGKTLDTLYAQADAALYRAKKAGKNQFTFAPLPSNAAQT